MRFLAVKYQCMQNKMMSIINRLFFLCNKGLKKLAYLIRERLNLIEVKILFVGLVLTALTGIYLLYLLFTDPGLYKVLSSTAVIHGMGGRGLGLNSHLSFRRYFPFLYDFIQFFP
jgi:hypothetical protein